MGLSNDKTIISDGKLLFIPSASGTTGAIQKYAVTMSGAFVSESILATANTTASFWYLRTPGRHSTKIFYQNTASSAVEPTGSTLNLLNFNQQSFDSTGSVVRVVLQPGMTGSAIVKQTAVSMRIHPGVKDRYTISSSGDNLFIDSVYTGVPPADDISFTYMTGSGFSYNVIQSGSLNTTSRNNLISGSATVQLRLNETDKDQLETAMEDSRSFMNVRDGFYGVSVTKSTTGSNISMHGGIPSDIGLPLPNSPYIKTNSGFAILMDNAGSPSDSSFPNFQVFKHSGVPGFGGTELLTLDHDGNLSVAGTISNASGSVDGGSF